MCSVYARIIFILSWPEPYVYIHSDGQMARSICIYSVHDCIFPLWRNSHRLLYMWHRTSMVSVNLTGGLLGNVGVRGGYVIRTLAVLKKISYRTRGPPGINCTQPRLITHSQG